MRHARSRHLSASAAAVALLAACATGPTTGPMSFFITSVGSGNGANLGGLAGADAHCQKLAAAAGASSKTWRAYLSQRLRPGISQKAQGKAWTGAARRRYPG